MKIGRLVRVGFIAVFVFLASVMTACNIKNMFVLSVENSNNNSWTHKAKSARGEKSHSVKLTQQGLDNFVVNFSCSSGSAKLIFKQGDIEKTVDISNFYEGNVDLSGFSVGQMKITVSYDDAKEVDLSVRWES